MAERLIHVCDPCAGDGEDERAVVSLDVEVGGRPHQLDLCEGHQLEYDRAVAAVGLLRSAARPVAGGSAAAARRRPGPRQVEENRRIREWARARGVEMAERGRISDELREQFRAERARPRPQPQAPHPPVNVRS